MKHIRCIVYVACSAVYLLFSKDTLYTNSLTKAFFHKSQISDKVVCYFTREPMCNNMPQAQKNELDQATQAILGGNTKQVRFFIPLTNIIREARDAIPKINSISHEYYKIGFTEVNKPLNGIQIHVAYDPRYIGFEFETFNAIHTHKGIVFKFHHKQALQELNKKTDHILQYAYNRTKMPTIIIDSGHGEFDAGRVGYRDVKEKDINLQVGTQLGQLLKEKGYKVIFTRESDIFVPLDTRTTVANTLEADLFVSIHANGASKETVSGIETYWAPRALLKSEMHDIDAQTKKILTKVSQKRDSASKRLALSVHTNVLGQAKKFYNAKDRTVKESISQVLLGTDMPAALVELGFLSNKQEAGLLTQLEYQQALAQGICVGIQSFLKEV